MKRIKKAKKIGKLNNEDVYLGKEGELCLEKDNSYLKKMNAREKHQFFEQKDSSKISITNVELTILGGDLNE